MENPTAIFYPKLSCYLLSYLLLAHLFAAVCVIATMDGRLLCLLLFILLMSGIFYGCHYSGLLTADRVDSLQCVALGQWSLYMVDGSVRQATLAHNSIVIRAFMLLRFIDQQTNQLKVVLLFPDSLPKQQLKVIRRCARLDVM